MSAHAVKSVEFKLRWFVCPMDAGIRSVIETMVDVKPRTTLPRLDDVCIRNGLVYGQIDREWFTLRTAEGLSISKQMVLDAIQQFGILARCDVREMRYLQTLTDLMHFEGP